MANQYRKQIGPKAIEQIIRTLALLDPRVGQVTLDTRFYEQASGEWTYPLISIDLVESRVEERGSMNFTRWEVRLYAWTQRRSDWQGEGDAWSECHNILSDLILRFTKEQQFQDLGFAFEPVKGELEYMGFKGRDDILGVSSAIRFSTPLTICLSDIPSLGALPDLGASYGAGAGSTNTLTCSSLSGCSIIQAILSDIDDLYSLTGSSSSVFIQNGTNIVTGGTVFSPSINLVPTPSVTGLVASGTITGGTVQGNTINHYGETVSGGIYFQTANALDLSGNLTFDGTRAFIRGGVQAHTTGGFTGSTFFSGTTDLNHLLSNSVTNYFLSNTAVTFAGDVYITSGLTVSGLTVFLSDVQYTDPALDGKGVVTWLTNTGQLSGDTQFNYSPGSGLLQLPRVKPTEIIFLDFPSNAVLYNPPSNSASVTGSTSLQFHPDDNLLYAAKASASTIYAANIFSGNTNLNAYLDHTYVQGGTNVTTGGTPSRPTVNLASDISLTSVSASTFAVSNRVQADIQSVTLTGTVGTSSTSVVNATGLAFNVEANSRYSFSWTVAFRSSSTSGGLGLSVTGPSSPLLVSGMWSGHISAGTGTRHLTAYDDLGAGALPNVAATSTNYTATMNGTLVTGANAGTLQLRFCRGGSAGTITLMSGSTGFLIKG